MKETKVSERQDFFTLYTLYMMMVLVDYYTLYSCVVDYSPPPIWKMKFCTPKWHWNNKDAQMWPLSTEVKSTVQAVAILHSFWDMSCSHCWGPYVTEM